MNRAFRVLFLLMWLEIGLLLILVPWSTYWEANYFLNRFPSLIPFLLNPDLRGAISGLGLLDAFLAAETFRRRATALVDPT
jgi:hypothetical protein